MRTLYYSQLDEPNLETIKHGVETHKPERVVLLCETEWDSRELTPELAEVMNNNNVHLVVTFCSYPGDYYEEKTKYFNSIELVHWSTYWVHWTLMCSSQLNFDITYKEFKYPYICLNNKNHAHRCAVMDQLTRNDLLDKGIVTWHRFPHQRKSDHKYKFKYYDDSLRFLSDDFITKLDSFLIPPEYHESFLHVIGEATTTVTCISEKTWLPILYKKPWIIMSNQYFHQKLVDLGFELYDEIIDYSFDSEPDMDKRAMAIADNVKRISEQNVNELYQLIKPKAERNYSNFMRILKSGKYVPPVIIERAKLVRNGCEDKTFTDHRYIHICNTAHIPL